MPKFHNNILCVTPKELTKCGLSEGYINRALSAQRRGEVYCWENHKVGRNVFIHYYSLRDKYKEAVKTLLCNGIEPELYVKQQLQQKQEASVDNLINQITALVTSDAEEIDQLIESKCFTPTEVHQVARAAGWLRLLNDYDVKRVRQLGFTSIKDFRSEVFKRCLNEQTSSPQLCKFKKGIITSERWLIKNAADYKKEGIHALIHKGVGNVNREFTDTIMHAKLIALRSNPVKYSFEDTAMMYNDWALDNGKEQMTVSAVKEYLNRPKVKKVWFYNRHGKHAADLEFQQWITREKPSFPDALWSIDGTTMQLYYVDEKGKIKSDLYVYFITDANSTAIIGYSIAFAETTEMVEAALRSTFERFQNKPYQMQYDNSSANISHAAQNLMSNMTRVHFPCEPYKGRSKYVETIIGHFQQRVLRHYENFKGGNITATSLDSKASPELLAELKKDTSRLPNREGVLEMFDDAVDKWNSRGEKRDKYGRFIGDSKLKRYTSVEHEKRQKLNEFDRISMFMVEQRIMYRYGNAGIEVEVNGKVMRFIVPDQNADVVSDFIFANENLGKRFAVKIDRSRPFMIALYDQKGKDGKFITNAYEREYHASCVADMKKGDKARIVKLQQLQKEHGVEHARKELLRQLELLDQLDATGTDGFGWQDTSKHLNNKREGALEDAANGMSSGLSERQRKILKI